MVRHFQVRFAPSLVQLEDRLAPATFAVTSTADAGAGSLRQAMLSANASPGADSIEFNIPVAGVQTINLASALPAITGTVAIKGQTQPGFAASPLIELNGTGAGASAHGLVVNSSAAGTVIRGLTINRFDGDGVRIEGSNSHVRSCFIGTDNTGTVAQGNGFGGVRVRLEADNVTIGGTASGFGNLISGNDGNGVSISGAGTTGNKLQGNRIGTDQTGTLAIGNLLNGVAILSQTSGNTIGGTVAGARNVISGNGLRGVLLSNVTANTVLGNYIGTSANGVNALGNPIGIDISIASGNTIGGTVAGAGNLISGNSEYGVQIAGPSTGNKIKGNVIGLRLIIVTPPLGNGIDGIAISGGATNNVIGGTIAAARNVISGNVDDGVDISGIGTTGNIVRGNFIGTNLAGTSAIANVDDGVSISDGASGNFVGGTVAGSRNVISGNTNGGVQIRGTGTDGNIVQGNYIGTDKTGTAPLGNLFGVAVAEGASSNVIGGATPAARNIISSSDGNGVTISGGSGNKVRGNYIGTDKSGSIALGNDGHGVIVSGGATGTLIGGTNPGTGNVISANAFSGVFLTGAGTTGNRVQGNRIGVAASSNAAMGNVSHGVLVSESGNFVGGTVTGAGNVIANNGLSGVRITTGTGNSIQRNRIFSNGDLGIELGADGVTANDLNDPDAGPNDLLNFPELTLARVKPAGLRITGSINTELNKTVRIEFFASPVADASNYGEGQRYLGFILVQTLASNTVNFSTTLAVSGVLAGQVVTATATDQAGNTSEFSLALLVV